MLFLSKAEQQDQIIYKAWKNATELGVKDINGLLLNTKYYTLLSGVWWQVQSHFKSEAKLIVESTYRSWKTSRVTGTAALPSTSFIIKCAIDEWVKGEWTTVEFGGDAYWHKYHTLLANLHNLMQLNEKLGWKFREEYWQHVTYVKLYPLQGLH
ncbi:hypothetical protein FRB94_000971 [Tulasnella sp. JGI-2019a]|nr:hypothetical protein FRB94_000971 [Tulasnella sp. JGI-2019a]